MFYESMIASVAVYHFEKIFDFFMYLYFCNFFLKVLCNIGNNKCLILKALSSNVWTKIKQMKKAIAEIVQRWLFSVVRWQKSLYPRSSYVQMAVAVLPTSFIWPSCSCSKQTTAVLLPTSKRHCPAYIRYFHTTSGYNTSIDWVRNITWVFNCM